LIEQTSNIPPTVHLMKMRDVFGNYIIFTLNKITLTEL